MSIEKTFQKGYNIHAHYPLKKGGGKFFLSAKSNLGLADSGEDLVLLSVAPAGQTLKLMTAIHCTENNTTTMFLGSSSQAVMKYLKTIAKALILLVVVTLCATLNTAHAQSPNLSKDQLYAVQMNIWLDKLENAESQNQPMMVILDTNNKYSYGCLQFQMDTFIAYSKKYGVSGEMMDCSVQKELATKMVENDYGAWSNWYNSVKYNGAGYPPKES